MKRSDTRPRKLSVAVVDSDPLRCIGFQACLNSEADFELSSFAPSQLKEIPAVDVVLLSSRTVTNVAELLSTFRSVRPGVPFIVIGCHMDDDGMLRMISAGAKGCIEESASPNELALAIRMVHSGSVWAPRRVLASFVERAYKSSTPGMPVGSRSLTPREKEVLRMLVAGCSNKEIAEPLGIEERTVKAHVAKLMRKVGAPNRIVLSVQAVTHSLIQ